MTKEQEWRNLLLQQTNGKTETGLNDMFGRELHITDIVVFAVPYQKTLGSGVVFSYENGEIQIMYTNKNGVDVRISRLGRDLCLTDT